MKSCASDLLLMDAYAGELATLLQLSAGKSVSKCGEASLPKTIISFVLAMWNITSVILVCHTRQLFWHSGIPFERKMLVNVVVNGDF